MNAVLPLRMTRTQNPFDFLMESVKALSDAKVPTFPPFDIVKKGDKQYAIHLAVAGFTLEDISIELENRLLTVKAQRKETEGEYLFRGIAARSFEKKFHLAEHVEVSNASLVNGILKIDLAINVPEEKLPRKIEINSWSPEIAPKIDLAQAAQ